MHVKGAYKYVVIGFFFLLVVFIPLSVFTNFMDSREDVFFTTGDSVRFEDGWGVEPQTSAASLTMTKKLPDALAPDTVLCFRINSVQAQVRMDGQLLLDYGRNPSNAFGIPFGGVFLKADIPEGSEGKEVSVTLTSRQYSIASEAFPRIYLGGRYDVLSTIFKENLGPAVFAVVCGLIGAAFLIGSAVMSIRKRNAVYLGFLFLGAFTCLSGAWVLTDSTLMQFIGGNTETIFILSFLFFMLMPVAFFLFIRTMGILREGTVDILCVLYLLNAAVSLPLHIFGIVPLTTSILSTHALLIIGVLLLFGKVIWEIVARRNRKIWEILTGLVVLLLCSLLAIAQFYFYPGSDRSVLFRLGLLGFIICLSIAAGKRASAALREGAAAGLYKKLAYVDLMTRLKNRTAFEADMSGLDGRRYPKLALVLFDINGLKGVNDSLGHAEGDRLILKAADGIRRHFEEMGECYRIGGDEFVACVQRADTERIEAALGALEAWMEEQNRTDDLRLQMAWGFAVRCGEEQSAQEVLGCADEKMYEQKRQSKACREVRAADS